jgi:hypothetical protein
MRKLVLLAGVGLLAAGLVADVGAGWGPRVCRVVLFEDGSWCSPDYAMGEPWPPEGCDAWRVVGGCDVVCKEPVW